MEIFTQLDAANPADHARAWGAALVLVAMILLVSVTARVLLARQPPEDATMSDVPTTRSPDAMDEITQREDGAATPLMAPIAVSARDTSTATSREVVFEMHDLNVYYGETLALRGVNMQIYKNVITAMIGPSGCGKSTFVRSLNRMNDSIAGFHVTGQALYHGHDIYGSGVDPVEVRRRIGMVFQRPNPFPKSIFDNIAWAPRILGMRANLNERIEKALRGAALWDEVKDRLKQSALGLSGGQQQRLCIARAIAIEPDVLLLDEPASALDPISTASIEELMHTLKTRVHARDRDPQHAAGRARRRAHRVLQPRRHRRQAQGRARRVRRHREALHPARGQADRGLRHRPLRLGGRVPRGRAIRTGVRNRRARAPCAAARGSQR